MGENSTNASARLELRQGIVIHIIVGYKHGPGHHMSGLTTIAQSF